MLIPAWNPREGLAHLSGTWAGSHSPLTASKWSLILMGQASLSGPRQRRPSLFPMGRGLLSSSSSSSRGLRKDTGGRSWEVFC